MNGPFRPGEWERFVAQHEAATARAGSDDTTVVGVAAVGVPEGWSLQTTPIWFVVPVGYPAAQPDCFWASPQLRLANGQLPSNSNPQPVPAVDEQGLWFSWHLAQWRPATDTITTYMQFILRRFHDAR